jgi:hypothetical protein
MVVDAPALVKRGVANPDMQSIFWSRSQILTSKASSGGESSWLAEQVMKQITKSDHHRQIQLKINIYSLWNNSIRIVRSDHNHVSAFANDLSGILYKKELQHEYL